MLWWVAGQVVDDQERAIPEGSIPVPTYQNQAQYGDQRFNWDPANRYFSGNIQSNAPGYLTTLLGRLDRQRRGEQLPWYEADEARQWEATARAMPTRDIGSLTAGWQGELGGSWGGGATEGNPEWWSLLDPGSPDAGPIMLQLRDKVMHGSATPQERQLYSQVGAMAADWDYRATVPQESDANPFGMGDNLFGALMMLGMGASGGAAAAALAAGGLSLGAVSGLAGVAGGFTGMMGEALDEDALRKMGISLGAVGGAAGLAALASSGINTVGDLLKAVQKGYGVGSKVYGLARGAGSTPDDPSQAGLGNPEQRLYSMDPAYRGQDASGRTIGSRSQALTAADQRTAGRSSTGGSMAAGPDVTQGPGAEILGILGELGPLLSGAVGLAASGLSLASINRYMNQLKDRYGQQEQIKSLIDDAYNLARLRYETYYAQTQGEQQQKQTAYEDAWGKYQTHYGQTQLEQEQKQAQYLKDSGQIDEDRFRQISTWNENRRNDLANFEERRTQAIEDRTEEKGVFRDQYGRHLTREDEIAAQVRRDRDTQYGAWEQQFGRHLTREDRRAIEAAEERGLDLNAYQQRQAIGRNLSDPAAIKAGAEALYQPISALARDRINVQTEEEMARRGVAGGGQYSNLMAAKAFAPQERELWENAMRSYLTGQTGAVSAYEQQNLTATPEYQWAQRPEFSTTPRYNYLNMPDYATSPDYDLGAPPAFLRAGGAAVPGAVGLPQAPGVPGTVNYRGQPSVPLFTPEPYAPFGTSAATGGGEGGGAAGSLSKTIENLVRTLGSGGGAGGASGLIGLLAKLAPGLFGSTSTAGTLPTTMDAYRAGGYANTTYAPFGQDPGSVGWQYDPNPTTYMGSETFPDFYYDYSGAELG